MKTIMKYSSMFMLVWLQLYYFFEQLNSITTNTLFNIVTLCLILVYDICFFLYFFLFLNRKLSQKKIRFIESILVLSGFGLSLGIFVSYASNEWLWTEANMQLILLEMWKFGMMLFASLISVIFHFLFKAQLELSDKRLWNTYFTGDGFFFLIAIIAAFGLGTATSKIIPHTTRNYYVYLRIALTFIALGIIWYQSRVFVTGRIVFYAAVLGYFSACLSEAGEFLFLLSPLLKQEFLTIGLSETRITVMDAFTIINLVVILAWLILVYIQEKKAKVNS